MYRGTLGLRNPKLCKEQGKEQVNNSRTYGPKPQSLIPTGGL